jgi:CheY-like chemotaxis protein
MRLTALRRDPKQIKFRRDKSNSMGWTVLCVSKISPAQVTRNMILERAGYNVVSIGDPAEAIRVFTASVLTASRIAAVVLGPSMPAGQGLELAVAFKRLHRSVPVIALSQTSGSQLPAGVVDEQLECLGDPQLLLESLQRVLARNGDGQMMMGPGAVNPKIPPI